MLSLTSCIFRNNLKNEKDYVKDITVILSDILESKDFEKLDTLFSAKALNASNHEVGREYTFASF